MSANLAHILVVDDDRDNRELLGILLAHEGYEISHAASGEEALATVAVRAPDLIVLDVIMSGMDGFAVAARLKSVPHTQRIPIILLTGLDDSGSRASAKASGADHVLAKPIDRTELCQRVRQLLTI